MRTFEIKATVTPEGELRVVARASSDILPGEYRAILVLDETYWPGRPADSKFRREEIYNGDG